MNWVNFLHIYQPFNQTPDILEKVVNESYKKIFSGLAKNKKAKLVLNINASLTDLLYKQGYKSLINQIRKLAQNGQIEFTESAKFHSLLPLLPEKEIVRQIKLNHYTNKKYFGRYYKPEGFFPPELAYSKRMAKIIHKLGYKWMVLDDIAFDGTEHDLPADRLYQIEGLEDFFIFFRNRRLSNAILSAVIREEKDFFKALSPDQQKPGTFVLTLMDGETFGHHRPGLEKFLFNLYRAPNLKSKLLKEIFGKIKKIQIIDPVPSNWSSTEEELKKGLPYARWYNPQNKIQMLQWQFLKRILKKAKHLSHKNPRYRTIRDKIDVCLASDQFWWASAEPWWSIEMIERGAYNMLLALKALTKNQKEREWAQKQYHKILALAFEWQRKGIVRAKQNKEDLPFKRARKKIPLKKRVKKEWFLGLLRQLRKAEEKAVKKRQYEKAILWRDAAYKLEHEEDIYDTVSAVDLLREQENISNLDKVIEDDLKTLKKRKRKI